MPNPQSVSKLLKLNLMQPNMAPTSFWPQSRDRSLPSGHSCPPTNRFWNISDESERLSSSNLAWPNGELLRPWIRPTGAGFASELYRRRFFENHAHRIVLLS